jgi:hypothetical protein
MQKRPGLIQKSTKLGVFDHARPAGKAGIYVCFQFKQIKKALESASIDLPG